MQVTSVDTEICAGTCVLKPISSAAKSSVLFPSLNASSLAERQKFNQELSPTNLHEEHESSKTLD